MIFQLDFIVITFICYLKNINTVIFLKTAYSIPVNTISESLHEHLPTVFLKIILCSWGWSLCDPSLHSLSYFTSSCRQQTFSIFRDGPLTQNAIQPFSQTSYLKHINITSINYTFHEKRVDCWLYYSCFDMLN